MKTKFWCIIMIALNEIYQQNQKNVIRDLQEYEAELQLDEKSDTYSQDLIKIWNKPADMFSSKLNGIKNKNFLKLRMRINYNYRTDISVILNDFFCMHYSALSSICGCVFFLLNSK